MVWLAKFMQAEGYLVSPKSVLEPGKVVKWLGKEVDLMNFTITNLLGLQVRIVAYMVKNVDSHVSVKDLQRVMGLINWMATPATGHLPFLGGVYCAVAGSSSGCLRVTPRMWLAVVSAMPLTAMYVPGCLLNGFRWTPLSSCLGQASSCIEWGFLILQGVGGPLFVPGGLISSR